MTQIRVTDVYAAQSLFPQAKVNIVDARFDPVDMTLILDIEGDDVPDAEFVMGIYNANNPYPIGGHMGIHVTFESLDK